MAKQPETRDRFRITAEVEPDALGPLLAQLARIGLQNVGYELITDVLSFKQKKVHATNSDSYAAEFIKDHSTFTFGEIAKFFEADGRTMSSAPLQKLLKAGALIKVGPGRYQRTEVAPPPLEPVVGRGKNWKPRQEITNWDFIANAVKGRTRLSAKELCAKFAEDGRVVKSVSALLSIMKSRKLIKPTGGKNSGEYIIVKPIKPGKPVQQVRDRERDLQAAKDRRARIAAEKMAALNGSQPSTGETSHG